MSNALFRSLGGPAMSGPFGNMQNLIQQFGQFRQNFRGDPRQQVQQLLNSGRMSQAQYNQLQMLAGQFQQMLK